MPESPDISADDIPENVDEMRIKFVDNETGEEIDSFTGKQIPIPDEGDIVSVGWYDIEDGEIFEDQDGPFRVLDRGYYYIDRRNYDENQEGILTLVTVAVVPA